MFSHGLSSLKKAASTETRLTWRRTDSGSETSSQPKTIARPASGVSSVPRILISVDLPLPFGPRMPVTPPASTTRSSSWSATLSFHARRHQGAPVSRSRRRNDLRIPWISIAVIACLLKFHSVAPPRPRPLPDRGRPPPKGGGQKKKDRAAPNSRTILCRYLFCVLDAYRKGLNVR